MFYFPFQNWTCQLSVSTMRREARPLEAVFYVSASYSTPMVFQPSKIIVTSKITSLHWKLWSKRNITKSVFLLLDFFRAPLHGLQITAWETATVGAAIAWWINLLCHPLCLIWDSETYSRIRRGKCKAFCVFSQQLGCAASKDEPARLWDPVRLKVLKWKLLFVLSPMQQNRSHSRFGAGSWGKQQMVEM